jgi:uncharacterized glyoxalase superfamily protein PhnB
MAKLSFSDFDETQRRRLTDGGVPFQLLDKKSETIVIDSGHLKAMLDLLGADAEQSDVSAQYEGVVPMKLNARAVVETTTARTGAVAGNAAERAQYVSVCGKRIEKLTTKAEKSAGKVRAKVMKAITQMFALWRKDVFGSEDKDERRTRLMAEFESIKTAPHVQSVRVSGNTVIVKTDVLTATNPKTDAAHEIGQFTILIDLDGKNCGVRWFNRDRRVNAFKEGMNAPNVFADGTGCFNDMTQPMLELTARLELTVVVDLAIQFIENCGAEELGTFINLWPSRW